MKLKKTLRNKKGQIRGVDFAISLLLFLILLSQVILIVVNTQILVEGRNTINRDDLDYMVTRLFHDEGTTGWGYNVGPFSLTDTFGLKDERYPWTSSTAYLDPGKLARYNTYGKNLYDGYRNYTFPNTNISIKDYHFPSYDEVRRSIAEEKLDFSMKTLLPLSIRVNDFNQSSTEMELEFTVSYTGTSYPVIGARLDLFWVYLTNGTVDHRSTHVTNDVGQVMAIDAINAVEGDPFIVLVICRSLVDNGIAWYKPGAFSNVFDKPINEDGPFFSFTSCLDNGSVAVITDAFISSTFAAADNKNHTVSLIYPFNNTYAYETVIDTRDNNKILIDKEQTIPEQGLVIAVSAAYHGNEFYFKVHSLPAILNNDGLSDYPVLPAFTTPDFYLLEEINIDILLSGVYLASSRNVTLLVSINAWKSLL
ncbi:MAG: hypothetical protein ACXAEU_11700 [Candidatus Hodarchaeales archaeon]|jgi:hypothetical protein